MILELAYAPQVRRNPAYSIMGWASATVTAIVFLVPLMALSTSMFTRNLLRSPTTTTGLTDVLRVALTLQMSLMIILPVSGIVLGAAGVASSGKKCQISPLAVIFNALLLAGMACQAQ